MGKSFPLPKKINFPKLSPSPIWRRHSVYFRILLLLRFYVKSKLTTLGGLKNWNFAFFGKPCILIFDKIPYLKVLKTPKMPVWGSKVVKVPVFETPKLSNSEWQKNLQVSTLCETYQWQMISPYLDFFHKEVFVPPPPLILAPYLHMYALPLEIGIGWKCVLSIAPISKLSSICFDWKVH